MTVPLITVVLDSPEISDPTNFETKADNLLNVDLPELCTEFNTSVTAFNGAVIDFEAFAADAESDLTALLGAAGFLGTSTTSLAIGSGAKAFTTQLNLSFRDGSWGLLTDTANAANFMWGQMAYNPANGATTITVPANGYGGSGTKTSWRLTLTGAPGESISLASVAEALAGNSAKALTGDVLYGMVATIPLTYASTVAWDTNNGPNAYVILTGNGTIGAPTNLRSGVTYSLELAQDATGSRVPSWDSIWDFGVTGAPLLQTGANKSDEVTARYNARRGKLVASFHKGV